MSPDTVGLPPMETEDEKNIIEREQVLTKLEEESFKTYERNLEELQQQLRSFADEIFDQKKKNEKLSEQLLEKEKSSNDGKLSIGELWEQAIETAEEAEKSRIMYRIINLKIK